MVMPGQFLERPTLVDMGGYCLEALWHRGGDAPALLVLSPHPDFGGGCMDAPISLELAWAATRHGHATLRFNWRGVGASQGEAGDFLSACEDARHALKLLGEDVPHGRFAIAGCFFGARVALEIALTTPDVEGVFLIDSSADALDLSLVRRVRGEVCLVLPEEGRLPSPEMSAALAEAGVDVEVIPGADATFSQGMVQTAAEVARRLDSMGPVMEICETSTCDGEPFPLQEGLERVRLEDGATVPVQAIPLDSDPDLTLEIELDCGGEDGGR